MMARTVAQFELWVNTYGKQVWWEIKFWVRVRYFAQAVAAMKVSCVM
jgi:hypothetical protein